MCRLLGDTDLKYISVISKHVVKRGVDHLGESVKGQRQNVKYLW